MRVGSRVSAAGGIFSGVGAGFSAGSTIFSGTRINFSFRSDSAHASAQQEESSAERGRGSARGARSSAVHAETSAFDLIRLMLQRSRRNLQRIVHGDQVREHDLRG